MLSVNADSLTKESCTVKQVGDLDLWFEGYKTNFKVGVVGKFSNLEYNIGSQSAKNISELLLNYSVSIDKNSVYVAKQNVITKNLTEFFFNKLKNSEIRAKIVDVKPINYKKGELTLNVFLNDVTKDVGMKYYISDGTLYASGVIKLIDFDAIKALDSLNKACFDEHLGKTWSDVVIDFKIETQKICEKREVK
jgi:hypothetical protein